MTQVLVRQLDERLVQRLRWRAERHGRSLEQELREILSAAASLSPAERLQLADELRASTPPAVASAIARLDLAGMIREDRGR